MTRPQFQAQSAQRRDAFRAARMAAGHTQAEAGVLIGATRRTVENWEAGVNAIPAAALRLYLLVTDQDPEWRLVRRRLPKAA